MKTLTKQQAIAIRELDGEPTMSSLRIAEVTGKEHSKVTGDIERILTEAEIAPSEFGVSYLTSQNKEAKHYLLPEREFNLVVSGYSAKYRLQLIDELMSYRKQVALKTPTTYVEALKELIASEEARLELKADNEVKALKIATDAPKVQFATNISKCTNSINIGSYAKALSEEYGIKIGQNKLFTWMRENNILIKSGRRKNDPMQKYVDNNYFIVNESQVITIKGLRAVRTTLITGVGQLGLSDRIIKDFGK